MITEVNAPVDGRTYRTRVSQNGALCMSGNSSVPIMFDEFNAHRICGWFRSDSIGTQADLVQACEKVWWSTEARLLPQIPLFIDSRITISGLINRGLFWKRDNSRLMKGKL